VRLGLHPDGLAPRSVNLAQVRACLSRQIAQSWDPEITALYGEFLASDTVEDGTTVSIESEITIPMSIRHRGQVLRLFSTITTFGTPQDVTLEEIAIESYDPADAQTAELLRHPDLDAAAS
jgi:MmyB-like transcription regulator ligand binding domain